MTYKKILSALLMIYCGILPSFAEEIVSQKKSAKEIMFAVDERYTGDTKVQVGVMTLIDDQKNKRIRKFKEFNKKVWGRREIDFVYSFTSRSTGFLFPDL